MYARMPSFAWFLKFLSFFYKNGKRAVQGIPSQTEESNLALREGRKDISDILWHFLSRKHKPILISELTFIKKEMGNYQKLHFLYVIK